MASRHHFVVEDQSFAMLRQRHFDAVVALRKFTGDPRSLPPRDDTVTVGRWLEAYLTDLGWRVLHNESGDINRIAVIAEEPNAKKTFKMFQTIAPFVRAGSFLNASSEGHDEKLWTWTFDGKTCSKVDRVLDDEDYEDDDEDY